MSEIKSIFEQDRQLLECRIENLQNELQRYRDGTNSTLNNSFTTDAGKEISIIQITEQLADMAQKYSDLRIKSSNESRSLKDKIKSVEASLKEAREYGSKFKKKFDDLTKSSKDDTNKLKVKIKSLELINNEANDKLKEYSELRIELTKFKKDLQKYEKMEVQLKDAIKKKKEELVSEKKLRKTAKSATVKQKGSESTSQLEKNIRRLSKENNDLKYENKTLKNRLSSQKDIKCRELDRNRRLSRSFAEPATNNSTKNIQSNYETGNLLDKTFKQFLKGGSKQVKTLDNRKGSFNCLPRFTDLKDKEEEKKLSAMKS